jgi:hypothetical protein
MSKVTIYYILLAAILVGKVGFSLYERSLVVHHGFSVSEYHQQQKDLNKQKAVLTAQLAEQRSIIAVKSSAEISQFTPVKSVLAITPARNVASLQ